MVNKACEYCWKIFDAWYHKAQKFCCYECFNKTRTTHKNKKCLQCWTSFHPKDKTNKFCSKECVYKHRRLENKHCLVCWTTFHSSKNSQKYCSKKCYWQATKLTNKTCPMCKKEFKPKFNGTIYCSKECRINSCRLTEDEKKERDGKNVVICPICKRGFIKKKNTQKYCSKKCVHSINSAWNKRFKKFLEQLWYTVDTEFYLWWYYFDFKIWDVLLELNPYPYHNSTCVPSKYNIEPKDKMYHYNKNKCAVDSWYRCVMIREWTTNLTDMVENGQFHYEWPPQLHYYNPKTKEHLLDNSFNRDDMIKNWYVEIRDCGKESFNYI